MKNYERVEVVIKPENIFLVPDTENCLYVIVPDIKNKEAYPLSITPGEHYYQAMAYQDGLYFKEMGYIGDPEGYYEALKTDHIDTKILARVLTGKEVFAFGPTTDPILNDRYLRPYIEKIFSLEDGMRCELADSSIWMTGWEAVENVKDL